MKKISIDDLKIGTVFSIHETIKPNFKICAISETQIYQIEVLGRDIIINRSKDDLWGHSLYIDEESWNPTIQQTTASTSCNHTNKFRNHAGGQYFWQCSVCKVDLGNV